MIWCTLDILEFRRQWHSLTSDANDNEEYMDITEQNPDVMFYFPDMHNTGGLFMRVGAGSKRLFSISIRFLHCPFF